jgi:cytochrome c oxidase subunit II
MNDTFVAYNLIYLGLVAIGLVIFAVVFLSTRKREGKEQLDVSAWKRRENVWLIVVALALSAAVAATIFDVPWRAEAKANRQIVHVEGQQFGFVFDEQTYTVGRQVEFVLTATDVNHAFAIFDPDGTFIAQGQMMPEWEQRIRVTFDQPGTYTVRCFEYCGLGHHQMIASFEVEEGSA